MTDMTGYDLTCDAFADRLADYLEGDLGVAERESMDAHAAECESCRALLEELRQVTRDAAQLPRLVPSRDLWPAIAERIDASVLPIDGARAARHARIAIPVRPRWSRPAIAAAALVLVTAGITHVLTRVSMAPPVVASTTPSKVAAPAASVRDSVFVPAAPVVQVASTAPETEARAARGTPSAPSHEGRRREAEPAPRGGTVRLARAEPLLHDVEPVYQQEITELRRIVRERRSQLDPRTVAVLEQSVAVIDSAIAQSRAALARDPASGLLATQLNHSLEKKVELLRTAALLPART